MQHHPILIWSFFFGLILASVYFVGKRITNWNKTNKLVLCIGTIIALKIEMTALPQLVAAFHSLVGLAAVFVAAAAFYDPESFNIGIKGSILKISLIGCPVLEP